MLACPNPKTREILETEKLLNIWLEIMPLIQADLNRQTSLFSYLARMDFMLLKERVSLKRLVSLSDTEQKYLASILGDLNVCLKSSDTESQLLAEYLERINLVFA